MRSIFFITFGGFCFASDGVLDMSGQLASFGIGSSAVMWWTIDSMHRRREIAFVSLWIGFSFWMIALPAHVLSTRPRAHARKRIVLHALLTVAAFLVGTFMGLTAFPRE